MALIRAKILVSTPDQVEIDLTTDHDTITLARAWVDNLLPAYATDDPEVIIGAHVEIEAIEVLYAALADGAVAWAYAELT